MGEELGIDRLSGARRFDGAMSILRIVIIASITRLAAAGSGSDIPAISAVMSPTLRRAFAFRKNSLFDAVLPFGEDTDW